MGVKANTRIFNRTPPPLSVAPSGNPLQPAEKKHSIQENELLSMLATRMLYSSPVCYYTVYHRDSCVGTTGTVSVCMTEHLNQQ